MDLLKAIEKIAPIEFAEEWDNCGFQIELKSSFEKVLVSLDITSEVIEEAKQLGADIILVHHPMFFTPISKIDDPNTIELIKSGISVYTTHTNFDAAPGGNNDYLANLLALENIQADELVRTGEFSKGKTLSEVNELVEEKLETTTQIVGDRNKTIKNVLICTGAGGDFVNKAKELGCDLLITGEVKYHEAILAKEVGVALIEAGHNGTEKIFVPNMAAQLRNELGTSICVEESKIDTNPYL